jgi:hypothetical protein
VEVLKILIFVSQILLKTVHNYQQHNIYWLLLIRTAWLHVSTGYLVVARPVLYTKDKKLLRHLILYLD